MKLTMVVSICIQYPNALPTGRDRMGATTLLNSASIYTPRTIVTRARNRITNLTYLCCILAPSETPRSVLIIIAVEETKVPSKYER